MDKIEEYTLKSGLRPITEGGLNRILFIYKLLTKLLYMLMVMARKPIQCFSLNSDTIFHDSKERKARYD